MIDRFRRAPIRLQFIVLAAIPIPAVLLSVIALLPEPFIFQNGPSQQMVTVRRTQIELIVNQLRQTPDQSEAEKLLNSSVAAGLQMRLLPSGATRTGQSRKDSHFISNELQRTLPSDFEAAVIENRPEDAEHNTLAVRIDKLRMLLIRFPNADVYPSFLSTIVELVAKIIILILPMLLLVLYIGGMITSPLVRFASAAKNLRLDDNKDELFAAAGAEELRALATALNDMKRRIRKMVDDRTRMLTAVGHDLRTPLTRLQMRVERSKDPEAREAMLADIATLIIMIEDSLQYLSSTGVTEQLRKVDVSSLLQTITSGFCDLGHAVTFNGPERFGYVCKQKALVRAITNIVENAVRFGTIVVVELQRGSQGDVAIIVSDNGPGIEHGLQDKVLEPFFKTNEARTSGSSSGFGLGLSIADEIIKDHGGSLLLENTLPHGLRVEIQLPPAQFLSRPNG